MDASSIAASIDRLQNRVAVVPLPQQWPSRRLSYDDSPHLLAQLFRPDTPDRID